MVDGAVRARRRMRAARFTALLAALVLGALAWAALAPIEAASRDALFEIPRGTFARRIGFSTSA